MWFSRRALKLHVLIIVIVPTFTALCIWQVNRAVGGNELSWAYVFEWPFFAGYAVYMWWRFVHESPPTVKALTGDGSGGSACAASTDPGATDPALTINEQPPSGEEAERAAYNDYLAQLTARNKRKQWR